MSMFEQMNDFKPFTSYGSHARDNGNILHESPKLNKRKEYSEYIEETGNFMKDKLFPGKQECNNQHEAKQILCLLKHQCVVNLEEGQTK